MRALHLARALHMEVVHEEEAAADGEPVGSSTGKEEVAAMARTARALMAVAHEADTGAAAGSGDAPPGSTTSQELASRKGLRWLWLDGDSDKKQAGGQSQGQGKGMTQPPSASSTAAGAGASSATGGTGASATWDAQGGGGMYAGGLDSWGAGAGVKEWGKGGGGGWGWDQWSLGGGPSRLAYRCAGASVG